MPLDRISDHILKMEKVQKDNPYHAEDGKFTTKEGAGAEIGRTSIVAGDEASLRKQMEDHSKTHAGVWVAEKASGNTQLVGYKKVEDVPSYHFMNSGTYERGYAEGGEHKAFKDGSSVFQQITPEQRGKDNWGAYAGVQAYYRSF